MKRQPILTADEVLQLLEKELQEKDRHYGIYLKALASPHKLTLGRRSNFILNSETLMHCKEILREKGIYVYYKEFDGSESEYFKFIAGECGRVIEEMAKLEEYLINLEWFVSLNEDSFPPEVTAEKEKLENYSWRICSEIIFPLEEAYIVAKAFSSTSR
jgi:hypothetical protein